MMFRPLLTSVNLCLFALWIAVSTVFLSADADERDSAHATPRVPLLAQLAANGASAILENNGQIADPVKFYVPGSRSVLFFAPDELVLKLGPQALAAQPGAADDARPGNPGPGLVVRMKFEGGKSGVELAALDAQQGTTNVIRRGSDGTATTSELKRYSAVVYRGLYPGIDLECRVGKNGLSRTLVFHEGANPKKVQIKYEGVERVRLADDGQLELLTDIGVIRESSVVVRRADKKEGDTDLVARYVVTDNKTVGIETGSAK